MADGVLLPSSRHRQPTRQEAAMNENRSHGGGAQAQKAPMDAAAAGRSERLGATIKAAVPHATLANDAALAPDALLPPNAALKVPHAANGSGQSQAMAELRARLSLQVASPSYLAYPPVKRTQEHPRDSFLAGMR